MQEAIGLANKLIDAWENDEVYKQAVAVLEILLRDNLPGDDQLPHGLEHVGHGVAGGVFVQEQRLAQEHNPVLVPVVEGAHRLGGAFAGVVYDFCHGIQPFFHWDITPPAQCSRL